MFGFTEKHTGTDLNRVFKTFLERMAFIKQRVGEERFKEHRHVIIVFTDGNFSFLDSLNFFYCRQITAFNIIIETIYMVKFEILEKKNACLWN